MKTINQLANATGKAKSAYVYTGYCRQNNYILCSGAHRAKPELTPVNTGKVLIGSAYQPNLKNLHATDQEWLQGVLLKHPESRPGELSQTVLWWLYGVAIVVIALTF